MISVLKRTAGLLLVFIVLTAFLFALLRQMIRSCVATLFVRPLTRNVDGGRPGLLLSPTMTETRKALAGAWAYKRVQITGAERYKDEADKGSFSHIGEAAEYGLIDAGEHSLINRPGVQGAQAWPTNGESITMKKPKGWNPLGVRDQG